MGGSERVRRSSPVRFPAARQQVLHRSISAPPAPTAPKALKEPRYKACKVEMQRQLDESEKVGVTFMSEDIDLRLSLSTGMTAFWNSMGLEDAGKRSHEELAHEMEKRLRDSQPTPEDSNAVESHDKRSHEELTHELEKRLRDSRPTPEASNAEERLDGSGRSGGTRPLGRMSRLLRREPCQDSSSHGDATQGSSSRDSSRDTSRILGRATGEVIGRSRDRQPPGGAPSWRGHCLGLSAAAPAPSQRRLQPVGVADEAPASCAGDSASANSVDTCGSSKCSNILYPYNQDDLEEDSHEEDEEDDDRNKEDERTGLAAIVFIAANYDSKGRCIHHPHVRLRKKKMLGKGWRILLSACPECCMNELRRMHAVDLKKRIHTVDEKEKGMAKKALGRLTKNENGSNWFQRRDGEGNTEVGINVTPGSVDTKQTKMAKKTRKPMTKGQEGLDWLHRSKGGGDEDAGPPTSGSVGSARACVTHGIGDPTPPRPGHLRRAPSKEGSAVSRSQNQRSPPQNDSGSARNLQRLSPQDGFCRGRIPPPPRKVQPTTGVAHDVVDPGRWSPRSASGPQQSPHPVQLRSAPSQEGRCVMTMPSRAVALRSQNQQLPPPVLWPPRAAVSRSQNRSCCKGSIPPPPPRKAQQTTGIAHGAGNPGCRSPRSASGPSRSANPVHPRKEPSQEGRSATTVPSRAMTLRSQNQQLPSPLLWPPRAAVSRSQNQRSPYQEGSRSATDRRRLSPQNRFSKGSIGVGTSSNARSPPPPQRKAQQTTGVAHGAGDPGCRRPWLASGPPRSAHPVHQRRAPSQESSLATTVPPRTVASGSQIQPLPSQDGLQLTPDLQSSPPQDIFCNGSTDSYASSNARRPPASQRKVQRTIPYDEFAFTPCLTESEQLSSSNRSPAAPVSLGPSAKIVPLLAHEEHVCVSLYKNQSPLATALVLKKEARSKSSSGSSKSYKSGEWPQLLLGRERVSRSAASA